MDKTAAVETKALTKRYGKVSAVEDLGLTVRHGEVYGFLGPNGAGKTTTLKMLLGLIIPTVGSVSVLGRRPGPGRRLEGVGALVESPAFYPYLSGWDNLRVIARYSGGVPQDRIRATLERVGLAGRGGDKFRKYSLGMKQRLGVAAALLGDPELLILDEPTNGLDPKGVAEMRRFIRSLGEGERTVLLSSHALGEVEQICDRVGIIQKGSLVAEGTVAELRGGAGLLVRAEPLDSAAKIAGTLAGVEGVRVADGMLRLFTDPERAPEITGKLVNAGIRVIEMRPTQRSLEEAFLDITDGKDG